MANLTRVMKKKADIVKINKKRKLEYFGKILMRHL